MATAASHITGIRSSARTRILMRGTVFAPTGAAVAWIRDISYDGAQVAVEEPIPVGCDVIFKRGLIFAAAHVAWSQQGSAGLKFYRELDDEALQSAQLPLANRDD